MQKLIFLICILLFPFSKIYSQVSIEGKLKTQDKKPLPGINIIAYDINKSDILNYTFSDENGDFQLDVKYSGSSFFISTKSLAYKDTCILIPNKSQKIELVLPEQINNIEEVTVEGYPISAHGDTIVYTVKSFAQEKDLSIGDVIKRLPGFDVDQDGKISYQGQPIQKYYIEGLDLLEQRYTIANRNLPHKAVTSVEVMQNHQPIKILENKIASDGTSLNIRLDKKIAYTGTMYAGTGLSPLIYDANISPMLFTKKQQIVASAQSNNIGEDLNKQHQPLVIKMGELEGLENLKDELLGISDIQNPEIENYRYLDNEAILFSYNHLLKINEVTELKINSSYYKDFINEKGNIKTSYLTEGQQLDFIEETENSFYNNSLSTNLSLLQNAKKRYLKNKLTFNDYWDEEKGSIQNPYTIGQHAKIPHLSLSNIFDTYIPIKQNLVRFYSFVDYNHSPQSVSFMPGVFEQELNNSQDYIKTTQTYEKENIVTNNFIRFIIKKKKWTFENEAGFEFEKQNIETHIKADELRINTDSFNNKLKWNYVSAFLKENIGFKTPSFYFQLELPIKEVWYNIDDSYYQSPTEIQRTLFTPSIYFRQEIGNFLSARLTIGYTSSLGSPDKLTQGYILNSYRQMSRNPDILSEKQGYKYSIMLKYKNPINGFFSDINWFSSVSELNVILKYETSGNGIWYYNAIEHDNTLKSDNLSINLGKFFSKVHTTVSINGAYSKREKDYLAGNITETSKMQLYLLKPGITISYWRFLDIEYNYQYQLIEQSTAGSNVQFTAQQHKGSIFINFSKKHQLGLICEYYQSADDQAQDSETFFSDLVYFYKPNLKKFRFRLKCNNIFNQQEFVKYYSSEFYLQRNSYQIRPCQFMLTIFYNL